MKRTTVMKGKQLANGKRRKLKQKKKEKAFTLDDIIIKQLMDLKKKENWTNKPRRFCGNVV